MTQVRAHWHRLIAAISSGHVHFTPSMDAPAPHVGEFRAFSPEALYDLTRLAGHLPYFVFDREVTQMVLEDQCLLSLQDMKRAGVFRLPFPTMIVELPPPSNSERSIAEFIILRDRRGSTAAPWRETDKDDDGSLEEVEFYGIALALCRDSVGEYVLLAPGTAYVDIASGDGNIAAHLRISAAPSGFLTEVKSEKEAAQLSALIAATFQRVGRVVGTALFCAVLMLATRGMGKEVIETERLNRQRRASGKPAVPRHTYVHIGKVYRSAAPGAKADAYVPRKSPRPHWVRGFTRSYHTGKDRTGPLVYHYIPPALVALAGTPEESVVQPTYKVTR